MLLRQVKLQRKTATGIVETTCWLPIEHKKRKVRKGVRVRLKQRKGWWTVVEVYGEPTPKSQINRGWDNNI